MELVVWTGDPSFTCVCCSGSLCTTHHILEMTPYRLTGVYLQKNEDSDSLVRINNGRFVMVDPSGSWYYGQETHSLPVFVAVGDYVPRTKNW
jgi:hypothetical protein